MKNNIKKIFLNIQDKYPFFGGFLVKMLRFFRFYFYYKPLFFINKFKNNKENIFKIYWIDPSMISCASNDKNVSLDPKKERGKVIGGDWDLKFKEFEDFTTYKGLRERFIDGKEWKQTKYYNLIKKNIEEGRIINGCHNLEKIDSYFNHVENLYESIKNDGYKTNSETLVSNTKNDKYYKKIDEVTVSIGRNGKLFFNDGAHRLSIAKILKIKKIPAMIVARHEKWVDFKNKLKTYAKNHGGNLYQPAYHFDLKDIPYSYGNDRLELIKSNISLNLGTVLDIGANFGYFCHGLEEKGFNCTAVEVNPQEVYFMKKLRDANEDKFKIVQESIFNFRKDEKLNHNIVLALYIFHHFLKREETYNQLVNFLNRLDCEEMFLGTHNPKEKGLKGAYKNFKPDEFVSFIIKNSSLNDYKLLKKFETGRRLYKIHK